MTDKKYVVSEEELKQICTDYSASRRLNLNEMVQDFLSFKQPVEFLDRERVETLFLESIHQWNVNGKREHLIPAKVADKLCADILSLAIPQPDEGKIREIINTELYDTDRLDKNWHEIIDKIVARLLALMKGE